MATVAWVVVGALIVLGLLDRGRGGLDGLLPLIGIALVSFFAGRAAWRWWKAQPPGIAGPGLLGACGSAALGGLVVALVKALGHVSSENYGMIIVWPLVFLLGIAVACGCVLGAALGVAVFLSALKSPARMLLAVGGAAVTILNLAAAVSLVRLILTG